VDRRRVWGARALPAKQRGGVTVSFTQRFITAARFTLTQGRELLDFSTIAAKLIAPSPLLGASRTGAGRQTEKMVYKYAAIVYVKAECEYD